MTRRLFVLVLLFILTACSGPLTVGGTFTARQDDGSGWRVTLPETRLDVQALAAYTLTPTATATPTLTSTPTPTATNTPTVTPTPIPAGYWIAVDGNDANPGTYSQPWLTLGMAKASMQSGDTVNVRGGVYVVPDFQFGPPGLDETHRTTYRAAQGERVILTHADGGGPSLYLSDYVRLEGLWMGGAWKDARPNGLTIGAKGVQLISNTLFGYEDGINQGVAEWNEYRDNRFVLTGQDRFAHGIYLSGGAAPNLAQHAILDGNLFVGGEGYAVHGWHDTRNNIVTRNFITGHYWGLVLDGSDHVGQDNVFWRLTGQPGREGPIGAGLRGIRTVWRNNRHGPAAPIAASGIITLTGNIEFGASDAETVLGKSAAEIDTAIAALTTAFRQPPAAILADTSIEPNFALLRSLVAPAAPAYGWPEFRAEGLIEWDRYGNTVDGQGQIMATTTRAPSATPAPTITGTPTMTPLWNTLTPIATLPTYTTSLIQDTFNDTEGTALAAHVIAPVNTPSTSWTVHAGTWIISGNQVKKTAAANTYQSASVNAGIANADVSAVVYEQNTGIVARLTDDNNYWMLLVTDTSGIYIFEKTGGTFTPRAVTAATVSFPVTARFVVNGTTLTGYVNDKIVTFTSSVRQSATRHGLAIYPANAIADNFVVSNP